MTGAIRGDEDIHVPMFVRGPGVPVGQTRQRLGVNMDFAPTLIAPERAVVERGG